MKKLLVYLTFVLGTLSVIAFAHEHDPSGHAVKSLSSDSLFNSTTSWRDASGREVKLSDFRGTKAILTMAYTSCTYTCPLTIAKLKEIESSLAAKGVTDFKIIVASFDPKRDNPTRLSDYAKEKKLNAHWVLLCPKSDKDVRELAALLGVTYNRDKGGDFSHSNVISLLNEQGVVIKTLNGLAADSKPLMAAMIGE